MPDRDLDDAFLKLAFRGTLCLAGLMLAAGIVGVWIA